MRARAAKKIDESQFGAEVLIHPAMPTCQAITERGRDGLMPFRLRIRPQDGQEFKV